MPASNDPLLLRPPLAVYASSSAATRCLHRRLAAFFSEADIQQLDAALDLRGKDAQSRSYSADCHSCERPPGRSWASSAIGASDVAPAVEGRLYFVGQRLQRGAFDRIRVQGDTLDDVSVTADVVAGSGGIDVSLKRGALQARSYKGNPLETLHLRWRDADAPAANFTDRRYTNSGTTTRYLPTNWTAISEQTSPASRVYLPQHRCFVHSLRPALVEQLSVRAAGLLPERRRAARPRLEPDATPDLTAQSGLEPRHAAVLRNLQRYCVPCHDSAERFPPNFLSGDLDTVQAKLTHCAARIEYRLSMWDRSPRARQDADAAGTGIACGPDRRGAMSANPPLIQSDPTTAHCALRDPRVTGLYATRNM